MIVDYLRSCYSTKMRFFTGSPSHLSDVTFFRARPGARILPYHNHFASRNWKQHLGTIPDDGLGEYDGPQTWFDGHYLNAYRGIRTCTAPAVWIAGAGAPVTPPYDTDACCLPIPMTGGSVGGFDASATKSNPCAYWLDDFVDAANTNIQDHTPIIGTSYVALENQFVCNLGGTGAGMTGLTGGSTLREWIASFDPGVSNFTATLTWITPTALDSPGLFFRVAGGSDLITWVYDPGSHNWFLIVDVGGVVTTLLTVARGYAIGAHNLVVNVNGSSGIAYYDGVSLGTWSSSAHLGATGMWIRDAQQGSPSHPGIDVIGMCVGPP